MDPSTIFWLVVVALGVGIGYFGRRSPPPPDEPGVVFEDETEPNHAATALKLFGVGVAGLLGAIALGSETWTWVFGIGLMAYVPIAVVILMGLSIGRSLRRRRRR